MKLYKYIIGVVLFCASSILVRAQNSDTTYWKRSFKGGLNLSQASFSSNWSAGGFNSIGAGAYINAKANYQKEKNSWDNQMELLYGFVNTADQGYRKANDRIFLDTKYGYALSAKWNMFLALNFTSQFAKGYKFEKDVNGVEQSSLISAFLAPGYITTSWGFEYHPVDYFHLRLSPFAPRATIVRISDLAVDNNYGVPVGQTVRYEWLAFQALADFDKDLSENVHLKWIYMMYINYENLTLDQIDHRLDAVLSVKLAKYFDIKLNLTLLYDKDQDDKIQVSQGLGIGFAYSIQNYKEEK